MNQTGWGGLFHHLFAVDHVHALVEAMQSRGSFYLAAYEFTFEVVHVHLAEFGVHADDAGYFAVELEAELCGSGTGGLDERAEGVERTVVGLNELTARVAVVGGAVARCYLGRGVRTDVGKARSIACRHFHRFGRSFNRYISQNLTERIGTVGHNQIGHIGIQLSRYFAEVHIVAVYSTELVNLALNVGSVHGEGEHEARNVAVAGLEFTVVAYCRSGEALGAWKAT